MAGRIPSLFIHALLSRTNIVELINNRIKLKKQGKNYYACCPFHNEKHPSFTVSNEKQFYYCFGCGVKGNAIDFLIHYDRLNFVESIEELAMLHGLNVPNKISKKYILGTYNNLHQNFYQIMDELNKFYQYNLQQSKAQFAKKYLLNRGLTSDIIDYFSIGYAPIGWCNILKKFGYKKENFELLIKIGMLVRNNKENVYDRFRNRLMFPVRDKRGRVVGFGGRVLNQSKPKYLNSPETFIFHKSRQLYGLYEVQKYYKQQPACLLVVEGYMDVITLTQYGINYAVSSFGTSTTVEHIQLLFRITEHVIFCYDGDYAGRKAAWRALKIALPYMNDGRQLRFMLLPNGEDPDTLIRKEGKINFEIRIKLAKSLSIFLFERLLSEVNLSTSDGKTKLAVLALPLINQIPGKILRIYMRQTLGRKLGILDDYKLDQIILKTNKNKKFPISLSLKPTRMRILISLLVQNPRFAIIVPTLDGFNQSKIAGLSLFIDLVTCCMKYPNLSTGQLLELYRGTNLSQTLETLATWNHMIIDEEAERVFHDSLTSLYDSALEQRLEELIALDRTQGLNATQRREFWSLRQILIKK
ncbi:DNA primase [Pantoea sp. Mhis]|uniref:DNA primase n=1 Tax=Pantoea sp. Mhis TaxID=2576759 RepID=UPI0013598627|nr:DNA primase [Pantoea sp. Mhis]MXP56400.1 DNA primase [Pantoea sp. Mhis]